MSNHLAAVIEGPTEAPSTGMPIAPGELLTMLLVREGDRDAAVGFLAETLAELGISGEEIAHWQKQPGICHDCNETDQHAQEAWRREAEKFSKSPISMWDGFTKKDYKP